MLYLKFLGYLLRHKFWVFYYGRKFYRLPHWRLMLHDLDKLFLGFGDFARAYAAQSDSYAALQHATRNKHHWQYWAFGLNLNDWRMPLIYQQEMIVDWFAANRTKQSAFTVAEFYRLSRETMRLHPDTAGAVQRELTRIGRRYGSRG